MSHGIMSHALENVTYTQRCILTFYGLLYIIWGMFYDMPPSLPLYRYSGTANMSVLILLTLLIPCTLTVTVLFPKLNSHLYTP